MFKEFRKLAADVGPWAAVTLYLYAWTWQHALSLSAEDAAAGGAVKEGAPRVTRQTTINQLQPGQAASKQP